MCNKHKGNRFSQMLRRFSRGNRKLLYIVDLICSGGRCSNNIKAGVKPGWTKFQKAVTSVVNKWFLSQHEKQIA